MATVCDGISVLDLSQGMSGSMATMVLADNGAEVIKVEPPGGDQYRSMPAWIMWNRGKKSVVLDLETRDGRATALRLAQQVDVVIESFTPGSAEASGLDYPSVSSDNPRVIFCSITAFGSKGAYIDLPPYEGIVHAKAGQFKQNMGWMNWPTPAYLARPNAAYAAANLAIQGIMAALRARLRTGKGQRVETSLYQGLTVYDSGSALNKQMALGITSVKPQGPPAIAMGRIMLTYMVARCKDGQWIQFTNNAARIYPSFMKAIGMEHIYQDHRYKGAPQSFPTDADRQTFRRMVLTRILEKTLDEWMPIFLREGVAGDRFLTTQECMDFPQTLHNGGVVEIDDPTAGKTKQIGPLVYFSKTPSTIGRPAPLLGEHTQAVLAGAGAARRDSPVVTSDSVDTIDRPGISLKHPLEGLTILDFATWLAAPGGTSLIADLGARVIKIEAITGDEFRPNSQGTGRTFQGKESLVIDLKSEEGQTAVHALVSKADGLMHNMRGDAMNRLGMDYDTIRKINPNIVYLYGGSYGSSGPGAGRPAFHPTGGALSGGALWQLGKGNEPVPNDVPLELEDVVKYGNALLGANEGSPDVTSAIAVGTAMAMALFHKERTGEGQYLETTMLNSNGYMCSDDFIRYQGKPPRREPDSALRGIHALKRMYQTSEGWVYVECRKQQEWEALCRSAGHQQWAVDPRFRTIQDREVHDGQLIAALGLVFLTKSAAEWERLMRANGVPCVQADGKSTDEFLLTDPAVKANGFVVEAEYPGYLRMWRQGPAVQFSLTPGRAELAPPFGGDTTRILKEASYSDQQIKDMESRGVIKTA